MFGSSFGKAQGQSSRSTTRPAAFERLEGRRLMAAQVPAFDAATDAGDTVATAVSLGSADKAKIARAQTIGSTTDAADYYAFTVTASTAVTVKLKAGGKLAKTVLPALVLTNPAGQQGVAAGKKAGQQGVAAGKKAGKQVFGPGTYYVGVTGTPAAGTDGVAYKLSVVTKPSPKKAPTFTDATNGGGTNNGGNNDGGNNAGGQNGGTFSGELHYPSATEGNTFADQWEFVATRDGTFTLPATLSDDTTWSMVPYNPDGTVVEPTGGGGIGDGDNGALSVTADAGQKYVFSIAYAGMGSTNYSIMFDASFSQLVKTSAANT